MAPGRKTGGRNFVVGNPGGPGRPGVPKEEREAMALLKASRQNLRGLWNIYYDELSEWTQDQLQKLIGGRHPDTKKIIPSSDPSAPVLKLLVARGILYAMRTGKASELQAHKEMMCGPEPKQVELSGPNGEPLSPLGKYTPEQLAAVYTALDSLIKEAECKLQTAGSQPSSESLVPSLPPSSDMPL